MSRLQKSPVLQRPPVNRVRDALSEAGHEDTIIELTDPARSAVEAAKAVGCPLGAIVKSLVYVIENKAVMALIAGDRQCVEGMLADALAIGGIVRRPQASEVKAMTGFTIGGVAPVGLSQPVPTVIDGSLQRFQRVYAAAGHPHCVFSTPPDALIRMTGGW